MLVYRVVGLVRIDLEEEEAYEGNAEGARGEEHEEVAGIPGEDRTKGGKEEGAEPKGSQRESRSSAAVMGPVEC